MNLDEIKGCCFSQAAYDAFLQDNTAATLKAHGGTYGGGSENLAIQNNTVEGFYGYNSASTGDATSALEVNCEMFTERTNVRTKHTVRRLTPVECERLQGFPDNWTKIGEVVGYERFTEMDDNGKVVHEWVEAQYEYIDENGKKKKTSDTARYKALGNSIAIPPWTYILQKLALCCGADNTMASLFDGIGGFPLIWERLNGEGSCVWASEIEEFPIAVTKIHFPDKEG